MKGLNIIKFRETSWRSLTSFGMTIHKVHGIGRDGDLTQQNRHPYLFSLPFPHKNACHPEAQRGISGEKSHQKLICQSRNNYFLK
jgi:hypothetical protein